MSNHTIIIYSFSKLAAQIASMLYKKGYQIIIIEEDLLLLKEAKSLGYDVKQISLLEDENIYLLDMEKQNVKAFFCVSDNKNINLFVTLSVRNIYKDLKIISVSSASQDNKTMLLAGADKIINPYEIGALRIFRLIHKPYILDILDNILFSESNIEVSEITIKKGSIFDKVYLQDTDLLNQHNLIVLGILDKEIHDKFIFYSSGINHKVDAGDTLVLLGKSDDLENFTTLINQE